MPRPKGNLQSNDYDGSHNGGCAEGNAESDCSLHLTVSGFGLSAMPKLDRDHHGDEPHAQRDRVKLSFELTKELSWADKAVVVGDICNNPLHPGI